MVGGEGSNRAIADFSAMPEINRKAALTQIFLRATSFVDNLAAIETKGPRQTFREEREKLTSVLDAVPALVTTAELRASAIEKLKKLHDHSGKLTNDDIKMRCDEIGERLKVPSVKELWNALVVGGNTASKAITELTGLSASKRHAAFATALEGILQHAERFVTDLISNESTTDPTHFSNEKKKLLAVLDAVPALATTAQSRVLAAQKVAALDELARPLIDINIGMKCEEIAGKLRAPVFGELRGPRGITIEIEL